MVDKLNDEIFGFFQCLLLDMLKKIDLGIFEFFVSRLRAYGARGTSHEGRALAPSWEKSMPKMQYLAPRIESTSGG